MAIAAREYVVTRHIGPPDDFIPSLEYIKAQLSPLRVAGHIQAFSARVCFDLADLEWLDIDPEAALAPVDGKFPLVWLNLTYDPARLNVERLHPVEEELGCVLINSGESD